MRGRPKRTTHGDYGHARKTNCECDPCIDARRRYNRFLAYDRVRGITRRQDADAVRKHIAALEDLGARRHQIATAAGLATSVVVNIMDGHRTGEPAKWVLAPTAKAILALTPDPVFEVPTLVDPTGMRRRIRALEWNGHAKSAIARELGVSTSQIYNYMEAGAVYTSTVDAIDEVYLRLRGERGTSAYAMWGARRAGWQPWLAWDDETIDDPDAEPMEVRCLVDRCGRSVRKANLCPTHYDEASKLGAFREPRRYPNIIRRLNQGSAISSVTKETVRELMEEGLSDVLVAERAGCSKEYVRKIRTGER